MCVCVAGAWRCVNHDQNGDNEEEDASIIIPKYDMETIKKEESISQVSFLYLEHFHDI